MCLWSRWWKVLRLYAFPPGNRDQPEQMRNYRDYEEPTKFKRSLEVTGTADVVVSFLAEINRKDSPNPKIAEKNRPFQMDG